MDCPGDLLAEKYVVERVCLMIDRMCKQIKTPPFCDGKHATL